MRNLKLQPQLKLRAHHIYFLSSRKNFWGDTILSVAYSKEFADNVEKLKDRTAPDALVEIVSGLDDICKSCGCPYADYCKTGNYESLLNDKLQKMHSSGLPPFIIKAFEEHAFKNSEKNPETSDAECLREYNIKMSQTYRFKDLIDRLA